MDSPKLRFRDDGAELFAGAALQVIDELDALPEFRRDDHRAGVRLFNRPRLSSLVGHKAISEIVESLGGRPAKPVRAIAFDKSATANWSLGWHQDRTIAVRHRVNAPGFANWTVKSGVHHVEPPSDLMAELITLRIHLDAVDSDNAPLLIAPGSHKLGRIEEERIDAVVERCGHLVCLAERGDVWAYATPILHASGATGSRTRRRVLQVDYAGFDLPGGLEWIGL